MTSVATPPALCCHDDGTTSLPRLRSCNLRVTFPQAYVEVAVFFGAAKSPKGNNNMGMRTRKHAIIMILPRTDQQYALRHVASMQRAVNEYATMAQWMQPPTNAHETTRVEGTRLLVSLNVLCPIGNGSDVDVARAVTISGQAHHVPRQLAQMLEAKINTWRQRLGRNADILSKDDTFRCSIFLHLLDELAVQGFVVSVLTLAETLQFGNGNYDTAKLKDTLAKQIKIQFVLLRDEDENSGVASKNVVELLRGIKSSTNRNCSIRQLEESEIELQGVVKEWLHAAAPVVCATLRLGAHNNQEHLLEIEIRANFVLVSVTDTPTSSWMALHEGLNELEFHHFVPLKSVHPTMLLGCPLRASPTDRFLARGHALSRHLSEHRYGGLLSCIHNSSREFYLVVNSPSTGRFRELLVYRVASAEEILLPEPTDIPPVADNDSEEIVEELAWFSKLSTQDFNAFRNRSGVLEAMKNVGELVQRSFSHARPQSTTTSNDSVKTTLTLASEVQSRSRVTSKKKKRL